MAHVVVPEAEEVLDQFYSVLNHGFVRLVDYLGGDARVVQAARSSYGGGTQMVREDKALLDYMLSHGHSSPYEQVVLTFHVRLPIFVARQWVRHRTARLNEISGRYSVLKDEFYVPELERIQYQKTTNKQGSDEDTEVPAELQQKVLAALILEQRMAYCHYEQRIDAGIARELCRINLPLSLYTEWYWQIDLSNLMKFLDLRMDDHAQWEFRQYANVLSELARRVAPLAFEAFEEFVWGARRFSRTELKALQAFLAQAHHMLSSDFLRTCAKEAGLRGRRRREFLEKLQTPPRTLPQVDLVPVVHPQGE